MQELTGDARLTSAHQGVDDRAIIGDPGKQFSASPHHTIRARWGPVGASAFQTLETLSSHTANVT